MNQSRRRCVHELYAPSHEHDQDLPRLECFRNLEPPTAKVPVGAGLRLAVRGRAE